MIQAAISFLVIGILAYVLGANNFAGLSVDYGVLVMILFLALALLSVLIEIFSGDKKRKV